MTSRAKASELLAPLFVEQPCWMIDSLSAQLKYSVPSVRRFLSEAGYYSSFTHNGGWYTLRSIPLFGRDGLWFHGDVGFSRAGNLTKTLIYLVTRSPAGFTAEQLGSSLRCRCHSILVNLWRKGRLGRKKAGRSYVYLSVDEAVADQQLRALASQTVPSARLPAEIAVLVLAEFIRNPESSFNQLAEVIARTRRIVVAVRQIEELFSQHGLKKTP